MPHVPDLRPIPAHLVITDEWSVPNHSGVYLFLLRGGHRVLKATSYYDFEHRRAQFDPECKLLDLNPAGRIQNNKFRPVVPVTKYLEPWLLGIEEPNTPFVAYKGKPIDSISGIWDLTRAKAGFGTGFAPYSFRHGIARELRRRRVPLDEIGMILGHLPKDHNETSSIYAPMEAEYCAHAVREIEAVVREIVSLMTIPVKLDDPKSLDQYLAEIDVPRRNRLSDKQRSELIRSVKSGVRPAEINHNLRISYPTIAKYRKEYGQ